MVHTEDVLTIRISPDLYFTVKVINETVVDLVMHPEIPKIYSSFVVKMKRGRDSAHSAVLGDVNVFGEVKVLIM